MRTERPTVVWALTLFLLIALSQWGVGDFMRHAGFQTGFLTNELGLFVLLPLIVFHVKEFRSPLRIFTRKNRRHQLPSSILLIVSATIVLGYLSSASQWLFPVTPLMQRIVTTPLGVTTAFDVFLLTSLICVVAPICEEMLFRGIIQESITAHLGSHRAIVLTAVFFALIHTDTWHPHIYFLLGLVLSWIYAKTGSLQIPIVCHMINNTLAFIGPQWGFGFPVMDHMTWNDGLWLIAAASCMLWTTSFISNRIDSRTIST